MTTMRYQFARYAAAILGCVVATDAEAAALNVGNDAEILHGVDDSAMIDNEGPAFGREEAKGGSGDDAMFATAEVVPGEELGEERGGFVLDGLDIKLGAEVQTLVNGELAMTSAIRWTDAGVQTSQYVSDALSAPTAAQLQAGLLKTGNISLNVGNSTVYLANDGQTALIQSVNSGFQNVVVNTANNTNIQMLVNATVDLSGYTAFQANQQTNTLNTYLGMAMDNATIGLVAH
jgi:hypothetical protein